MCLTPIQSDLADVNDIEAGPQDLHLVQAILDLGSYLELPDPVDLVVDYDPELLDLAVSLGARRLLPQSRAGAC